MDKPAKAAKPAARKSTPAARAASRLTPAAGPNPVAAEIVKASPTPLPAVAAKTPQRGFRAIAGSGFVLAAAVAVAAVLLVTRRDDPPSQATGESVAVSASELVSFSRSQGAPVYWAGPLSARTLELTSNDTGSFVRYLPAGIAVGGSGRALTVATYPLRDAYGTAARRAKGTGMTSRRIRDGGLAVWSKAKPTSVYVAFRGVPSLVEVYAPRPKEALTHALSSRLRPIR